MSRYFVMNPVYFVRMNFKTSELEEKFNLWYNYLHLPDLHKVPGVISARRFIAPNGDWKYLAFYEFNGKDGMIRGKNSTELAACKADTRSRWSAHLDPKAERYWCDIDKVFKRSEKGMLLDSPTLFIAFDTFKEIEVKAHHNQKIIDKMLKLSELETLVLYKTIFKEPKYLPNRILLCQFQSKAFCSIQQSIAEILSFAESRKDLYKIFNYEFYEFMTSIVRTVGK